MLISRANNVKSTVKRSLTVFQCIKVKVDHNLIILHTEYNKKRKRNNLDFFQSKINNIGLSLWNCASKI